MEKEKERVRKEKEGVVEGSETEADVVVSGSAEVKSGSKEVEVLDVGGAEMKDRRALLETPTKGMDGSRSEISTEDEWERVEETEKDK